MVLVAVGDDDAPHQALLIVQVAEIGDDQVYAQHVVFGEHDPRVHDDDVTAVFQDHHVLAHFPQSSEGDDLQFVYHISHS